MQVKLDKFSVNDKALCLKDITFIDNTKHYQGTIYIVTEKTLAYFNINNSDYKKV